MIKVLCHVSYTLCIWLCDNRSRCPLGYKPCEHRKIESSLILSCGVHRAYSQVDIGYDYHFVATDLTRIVIPLQVESTTLSSLNAHAIFTFTWTDYLLHTKLIDGVSQIQVSKLAHLFHTLFSLLLLPYSSTGALSQHRCAVTMIMVAFIASSRKRCRRSRVSV